MRQHLARILSVVAFFFLPLGLAAAVPAPPVDYLFPPADLASRSPAVHVLSSQGPDGGEIVDYVAFNGIHFQLTRFSGHFIAILLPDTWMGDGKLTPDLVRSFVNRTDILYEHFRELVGGEPGGSGLLNIAVIPGSQTCGWGCGFIGTKGIEVADIDYLNPALWRQISADVPVDVVVHEMTHNFDLYSSYLYYLPGHAHAWTDFVNFLVYDFSRTGRADDPPQEVVRAWLDTAYRPYVSDPKATWADCVRDGRCEDRGITANNAWGGTSLRVTQLYGRQAGPGFFRFLAAWAAKHAPPTTTNEKEDLHVEALAAGAQANLGCFIDAWHWYASPALRARMLQQYGPSNAFCVDADGDGFTPLAGDCNDQDAAVHPGAVERRNGIDDDCDGVIDEQALNEPAAGDFLPNLRVELPVEITGQLTDGDLDSFAPAVSWPARVRARVCSTGLQGAVVSTDSRGQILIAEFVHQGACESYVHVLPEPGSLFDVRLYYSPPLPGSYVLRLAPAEIWPAPWAELALPATQDGGYLLTASALAEHPGGADEIRFWVDGVGLVGTVPYQDRAVFRWTPGPGVLAGTYSYRTQLLAGGLPISDMTPPSPAFRVSNDCIGGPATLCLGQGRFKLSATWRTPDGKSGAAQAVALTADTGYFWFFGSSNVEVVVKVLNGCPVNHSYWVFAGGLTNVETVLTVSDVRSSQTRTYTNVQGKKFQPVQDTVAFPTCP